MNSQNNKDEYNADGTKKTEKEKQKEVDFKKQAEKINKDKEPTAEDAKRERDISNKGQKEKKKEDKKNKRKEIGKRIFKSFARGTVKATGGFVGAALTSGIRNVGLIELGETVRDVSGLAGDVYDSIEARNKAKKQGQIIPSIGQQQTKKGKEKIKKEYDDTVDKFAAQNAQVLDDIEKLTGTKLSSQTEEGKQNQKAYYEYLKNNQKQIDNEFEKARGELKEYLKEQYGNVSAMAEEVITRMEEELKTKRSVITKDMNEKAKEFIIKYKEKQLLNMMDSFEEMTKRINDNIVPERKEEKIGRYADVVDKLPKIEKVMRYKDIIIDANKLDPEDDNDNEEAINFNKIVKDVLKGLRTRVERRKSMRKNKIMIEKVQKYIWIILMIYIYITVSLISSINEKSLSLKKEIITVEKISYFSSTTNNNNNKKNKNKNNNNKNKNNEKNKKNEEKKDTQTKEEKEKEEKERQEAINKSFNIDQANPMTDFLQDPISGIGHLLNGIMGILLFIPNLLVAIVITSIMAFLTILLQDSNKEGGVGEAKSGWMLTPDKIFMNKVPITNIEIFINGNVAEKTKLAGFVNSIASWYRVVFLISIAMLFLILLYLSVRAILLSVAKDIADTKNMLFNWVKSVMILFFMSFIIFTVISLNSTFVSIITQSMINESGILENQVQQLVFGMLMPNFVRMIVSTVILLLLLVQTLSFLAVYVKRLITIGFYILIAPIISVSYALDIAGDRKSTKYKQMA